METFLSQLETLCFQLMRSACNSFLRSKFATAIIINVLKSSLDCQCFSPPHPVTAAAAPPLDEEDMGSKSNKKPSSRALNTKKERGNVDRGNQFLKRY